MTLDDEQLARLRELAPAPPPWIGEGSAGPPPPPTAVASPGEGGDTTTGRLAQLGRLRLALWAVLRDRLRPRAAAGMADDEMAAAAAWCDCRLPTGEDGERGHARSCASRVFVAGWRAARG